MRKIHTGKKMSNESKEKNRIKHLKENLSFETIEKMKKSKSNKKGLLKLMYVLGEISHNAYRKIGFEKEAYSNQFNFNYLNTRSKYKFIKYI